MILANTVHAYPVLLIGGWIGVIGSMVLEGASLFFYLREKHERKWILNRFLVANAFSAVAGLLCYVVVRYPPGGSPAENVQSLILGVLLAFAFTLAIEGFIFIRKTARENRPLLLRALVMSNVFSYSFLVAVHLSTL